MKAAYFTDKESIFVVGIPPNFPSTSYGYLSSEGNLESDEFLRVRQFIEKPDYKKASELLKKRDILEFRKFYRKASHYCCMFQVCSKVLESVERAFGSFSALRECV